VRKIVNKLIVHGRGQRQPTIARDDPVEKFHVMLKGTTFDQLSYETFAFCFGIVSHAIKKEQAASDNGDNDDNKNKCLPALARPAQVTRAPILFE